MTDNSHRAFFFSIDRHDSDMHRFIEHVTGYFNRDLMCPVTLTTSISSDRLLFTFNDDLYRLFLKNTGKMKKPYECALKYGYRGFSKGGKNGIFLLRKQDGKLLSAIETLIEKNIDVITRHLDCDVSSIADLHRIKVVYHESSGERMVGVMDVAAGSCIFLGFANY